MDGRCGVCSVIDGLSVGAAWDGKGISGVASNVRLVSVQNYSEDGRTSLTNAMRAFDFIDRANEAGCGISLLSCSWNMLQANENLNSMIQYLGEKWGIVTMIAAGNENADLALSDPNTGALYENPYAVIVGATDSFGMLAPYSSYGKQIVDLAAPGSGILSTVCTDESQCEYFADAVPDSNKLYEGFEEPESRIYVYDPSSQSWTIASAEGVLEADTLAVDKEQLLLVGSALSENADDAAEANESRLQPATVRPYDPAAGAGAPICTLESELIQPPVAVKDGVICIYDQYLGSVERVRDGKSELLEDAFSGYIPEIADYESDYSWLPKRSGVLLPVSGGFLLVGPAASDGSGDCFLLRDEETVFTPYGKRMSDSKVFFPAAASVDGKVYVIGSTLFEPNQRIFRATTLNASGNANQGTSAGANLVLYIVLGIVLLLAIVAVVVILQRRRKKKAAPPN